jgi:hypothetical protein
MRQEKERSRQQLRGADDSGKEQTRAERSIQQLKGANNS